jgi:uncharacterized protein (TIGR03083 family)
MSEQLLPLLDKLRTEGAAVYARLAALTPEQWAMPLSNAPGAWRTQDLLAHLVSAERGHQRLIAEVAHGGTGSPVGFDVDSYNAEQVAALQARDPSALLAELLAVREGTLALVASLSDEDLARRGRHPALGDDVTLADFIRIITVHARMHLRELARSQTQASTPAQTS